jgi:predicted HicB family RNase H-like nuclease
VTRGQEPRDKRLTLRVPSKLHDRVAAAAAEDMRTMSDWLLIAITSVLDARDRRRKRQR